MNGTNYKEYEDDVAFHPGYYIKELVEDSGLTIEGFAEKLGTTSEDLNMLINGEQRLSNDMASKLSGMLGTTDDYWLNLQKAYDEKTNNWTTLSSVLRTGLPSGERTAAR